MLMLILMLTHVITSFQFLYDSHCVLFEFENNSFMYFQNDDDNGYDD